MKKQCLCGYERKFNEILFLVAQGRDKSHTSKIHSIVPIQSCSFEMNDTSLETSTQTADKLRTPSNGYERFQT
jgi:hypothetical protein